MKVFQSYKRLSAGLKEYISQHIVLISFQKNDIIQEKGEICDHIYFIEKGTVRILSYTESQAEPETCYFLKEKDFVISLVSLQKDRPRDTVIEVLEDSILWSIPSPLINEILDKFPEFNYHFSVMLVKGTIRFDALFKLNKSSDRFDYLRQEWPTLMSRLPEEYLAAFVGVPVKVFRHMKDAKMRLLVDTIRRR